MALKRQKRKIKMTVHRLIVTVDRLIVSFPIEEKQRVAPFLFLILKAPASRPRRRAMQLSAVGGGVAALI
jgi:hypothetical protein